MLLSLTIICLVAGAILAGVNMYTTGPIAASKAAALEAAIKAVTPEFDNKPSEDAYMAVTGDGDSLKIYPEWFSTDKNKQSVLGRSLSAGPLKVTKDGGNVDAITAATITSRAFLDAVNRAYSAFAGTDGVTGATTANTNEGGVI